MTRADRLFILAALLLPVLAVLFCWWTDPLRQAEDRSPPGAPGLHKHAKP
jgi:hypothetical protein